jgi:5-carboxymethyl-2-hydroxymuconate isomerase
MPHIVIEYTPNIDLDVPALMRAAHDNFAAQDTVKLPALKTRAIKLEDAIIGDGQAGGRMIHIMIIMLPGRADDLRTKMAADLQALARKHAPDDDISITAETIELHAPSYAK